MPLDVGVRLGPHEILSPLAAGGMGEAQQSPVIRRQASVVEMTDDFDRRLTTED